MYLSGCGQTMSIKLITTQSNSFFCTCSTHTDGICSPDHSIPALNSNSCILLSCLLRVKQGITPIFIIKLIISQWIFEEGIGERITLRKPWSSKGLILYILAFFLLWFRSFPLSFLLFKWILFTRPKVFVRP